jgi:hypothetical protein
MVTFNGVAPDPDTICLVSLDGKTWEHKTWREIQEIINPKQELYYDDLNIKEA